MAMNSKGVRMSFSTLLSIVGALMFLTLIVAVYVSFSSTGDPLLETPHEPIDLAGEPIDFGEEYHKSAWIQPETNEFLQDSRVEIAREISLDEDRSKTIAYLEEENARLLKFIEELQEDIVSLRREHLVEGLTQEFRETPEAQALSEDDRLIIESYVVGRLESLPQPWQVDPAVQAISRYNQSLENWNVRWAEIGGFDHPSAPSLQLERSALYEAYLTEMKGIFSSEEIAKLFPQGE